MKSLLRIGLCVIVGIIGIVIYARHMPANAPAPFAVAPKPPLPIELTFRKAILGQGAVATFKNTGSKIQSFNVKVTRKGAQPMSGPFVLDPGKIKELGHIEGWAFAPGDVVEVSANGFQTTKTELQ